MMLPSLGLDRYDRDNANQGGFGDEILREWEDYYNYHQPHGALDGQTPYERLVAKTRAAVLPTS